MFKARHCETSRNMPIPRCPPWNIEILKSQNFDVLDAIPVWVKSLTL